MLYGESGDKADALPWGRGTGRAYFGGEGSDDGESWWEGSEASALVLERRLMSSCEEDEEAIYGFLSTDRSLTLQRHVHRLMYGSDTVLPCNTRGAH